jgi:hypothetical protein
MAQRTTRTSLALIACAAAAACGNVEILDPEARPPDDEPVVDPCGPGRHDCSADATCEVAGESFTCTCNPGFEGDGHACTDIDECATGRHDCVWTDACENTQGSFVCDPCDLGMWTGDADVDGPEAIELLRGYTSVSGSLRIVETELASLEGLECLEYVGGRLYIAGNGTLTTLHGLDGLEHVEGDLIIGGHLAYGCSKSCGPGGNPVLPTLQGLGALTSIGRNLQITRNDGLTSLQGMSALASLGGGLTIAANQLLPTCAATELASHLTRLGWTEGPGYISGNDDDGSCP